jgi:hypothetical protein
MHLSRQTLETALHSLEAKKSYWKERLTVSQRRLENLDTFGNRLAVTEDKSMIEKHTTAIQEIEAALKEDTQP